MSIEFKPIQGKRVSGYEPNHLEKLAETMRLFILNPDLLRLASPSRYTFLLLSGLRPVINKPWDKVLENANERIINAALSWIKE